MNPHDLPQKVPDDVLITGPDGLPEAWVNMPELYDAGMDLALKAGAADGDQKAFSEAVTEVLHTWGTDAARYVIVSAFRTFAVDLVPMPSRLAKAATGVDFAAHCTAMLTPGYDPASVDQEGDRDVP